MITLAIDTSTAVGSVALLRDEKPLAEQTFARAPAEDRLFHTIQQVLAGQKIAPRDVELFAIGIGPGSFTGIRAGIAAIKGLALPIARPIKAAGSFDALALTAVPRMPRDCQQMCVLCDARRDEIYFALYDTAGKPTGVCQIGTLESIADEIHNPIWFVSPEIERYRDAIAGLFGGFATIYPTPIYPSAAALGRLAVQTFRAAGNCGDTRIEPLYLRAPSYRTVR
jgi:tRNA threonylcarbamoyladenosine biosynthesis protein TsaB